MKINVPFCFTLLQTLNCNVSCDNVNFVRTYCNTFEKLFYNKQLPTCCKIAHSQKKCFCTDGKKITCFTCTASIYKLRKLPKKVNTQLDILLSVCKRFCLYKSKTVTLPPLSTIKQMYKCVLHFLTHYPSVKPLQRFIVVLYT